jgi:malate permease and related proteins
MTNQILINLFIKILFLIAVGFGLKRKNIIHTEVQKGLNNLLVKVVLPVSIVLSSQNTFSNEAATNMLICALIAVIYYIGALFFATLISKRLQLNIEGKHVFITMVVFANVGFIGFPLAAELFGNQGTLYTVVYNICYQLIFFTYGISLLSGEKKVKLDMIISNPVTIASFLSVLFYVFQVKIPASIGSPLSSLGSMTVPLSMMLIGCNLAGSNFIRIMKSKHSYLVTFLRMVFIPGIFLILVMKLELPKVMIGTCAMLTALPSGSLNVIYAEQFQCEPEFASGTVVQTMLSMLLTLPVIIMIIKNL